MKLDDLKKLASMLDEKEMKPKEEQKDCCSDPECDCEEGKCDCTGSEMESEDDPVKEAAECLIEAERIKDDPVLFMKVQKELRKQNKAIKSIEDIKDRYVEVTIKSDPEDILDPESGDVSFKSKKVDGDMEDDD